MQIITSVTSDLNVEKNDSVATIPAGGLAVPCASPSPSPLRHWKVSKRFFGGKRVGARRGCRDAKVQTASNPRVETRNRTVDGYLSMAPPFRWRIQRRGDSGMKIGSCKEHDEKSGEATGPKDLGPRATTTYPPTQPPDRPTAPSWHLSSVTHLFIVHCSLCAGKKGKSCR